MRSSASIILALMLLAMPVTFAQRVFELAPPGTVDSDRPVISGDGRLVGILVGYPPVLHLVNADGSDLISTGITWVSKFDISFDGRLVALTHSLSTHGPTPHVDVLDTVTGQITLVSGPSMNAWEPAISVDGSTVIFTDQSFQQLYAVDSDGSNLRALTGSSETYQGGPDADGTGSLAVFDGPGPGGCCGSHAWTAPTDGSGSQQLTFDASQYDLRSRISADGSVVTIERYLHSFIAVSTLDGSVVEIGYGRHATWSGEENNHSDISGDGGTAIFSEGSATHVSRIDGSLFRQLPAQGRRLGLDYRGDVAVLTASIGGTSHTVSVGVPGQSPGEMFDLRFQPDGQTLSWVTTPAANSHNLYRAAIPAAGTVSPGASGSCLSGSIQAASAPDGGDPPPGQAYGWYVTGENGWGEGSAGTTAQGVERTPVLSCPPADTDGDAIPDASDVCPLDADPSQDDQDGDGLGDACDNCPEGYNPRQRDINFDGIGDYCECMAVNNPGEPETDGDGLIDACDLCPAVYNPSQEYLTNPVVTVTSPNGGETLGIGSTVALQWSATDDCGRIGLVDIHLSRSGPSGPFEPLVLGLSNAGTFSWMVTGPATPGFDAVLRISARDPAGNQGADDSDAAFRIQ